MTAPTVATRRDARGVYSGWIAGALVVLAVFVAGAVLWFHYHP